MSLTTNQKEVAAKKLMGRAKENKRQEEAANKAEKRNRNVAEMISSMPKMDDQMVFMDWKEALSDLAYSKEWLEEEQQQEDPDFWTPRDFDDISDESEAGKYARRACMLVMKGTMKNFEFLFEGVKQGNVHDMYHRIEAYFQPKTQNGFSKANKLFHNSNMAHDHVTVSAFACLVAKRAKNLNAYPEFQKINDTLKISIFANGLLPEFDIIKTILADRQGREQTFTDYIMKIQNYA